MMDTNSLVIWNNLSKSNRIKVLQYLIRIGDLSTLQQYLTIDDESKNYQLINSIDEFGRTLIHYAAR
jgi:ankyrin repeat protein